MAAFLLGVIIFFLFWLLTPKNKESKSNPDKKTLDRALGERPKTHEELIKDRLIYIRKSKYYNDLVNIKKFRINYIYHMTSIDNITSIIELGLLSHNNRHVVKKIDNKEVNKRRDREEPIYGRNLHKYAPFYFNPKNAMLYVNKKDQKNIVLLAFDKNLLAEKGVVFTDGNAARRDTKFFNSLEDLKKINWDCIRAEYWNNFENGKSERMAEILVPYRVGCESLCHIICYDNYALSKVKRIAPGVEVLIDKEKFF